MVAAAVFGETSPAIWAWLGVFGTFTQPRCKVLGDRAGPLPMLSRSAFRAVPALTVRAGDLLRVHGAHGRCECECLHFIVFKELVYTRVSAGVR